MAKKNKSEKIDSKKDKTPAKTSSKKSDSVKNAKTKKTSAGGNKVTRFFRDLRSEFKKVVWPSKKQVFDNTMVVLVTMIVLGAFVGGLDALMFKALQWIIS